MYLLGMILSVNNLEVGINWTCLHHSLNMGII